MKTTIKANYATVEGDYVIVRQVPYKLARFLLWVFFVFSALACLIFKIHIGVIIITFFVCIIINAILLNNETTYTVPKRDLIAIKRYTRRNRVTVVFDDEKSKLEILK